MMFCHRANLLLDTLSTLKAKVIFLCCGNVVSFALISKDGDELLSSYRPLYMLSIADKVLEKHIRDPSLRQFGFRARILVVLLWRSCMWFIKLRRTAANLGG